MESFGEPLAESGLSADPPLPRPHSLSAPIAFSGTNKGLPFSRRFCLLVHGGEDSYHQVITFSRSIYRKCPSSRTRSAARRRGTCSTSQGLSLAWRVVRLSLLRTPATWTLPHCPVTAVIPGSRSPCPLCVIPVLIPLASSWEPH